MKQGDSRNMRVIVIGAGASGIGAARTLFAAGVEVVVLEGCDRIGGRVKNHTLTKSLIAHSEKEDEHFVNIQLGANWIHGMEISNPMFEVAQNLKLELHQTSSDDEPGDDVILFDSGASSVSNLTQCGNTVFGRVSEEDYKESLRRYEWMKDYVNNISINDDKEDISLQAAFDLALHASEIDSKQQFGPCPDIQKRCLTWMCDRVSIDLAAPISRVSICSYLEGDSDGAGGECLVKNVGYSYVLEHLVREFPLDIRLNHVVSKISLLSAASDRDEAKHTEITAPQELQKDGQRDVHSSKYCVKVECLNGETYMADACIVTVPLSVLQGDQITFNPHPPSVINSVCRTLKMGLMNLVWLWYPYAFWPEVCNFLGVARRGERVSDDGTENILKFSTFLIPPVYDNFGVRQPVLMCQIVGSYALMVESLSDAEIAQEATTTLRAMFSGESSGSGSSSGLTVPDPIGCTHSQWGSNPFSRGSWSYFPYRGDQHCEVPCSSNLCSHRNSNHVAINSSGGLDALEECDIIHNDCATVPSEDDVIDRRIRYASEAMSVQNRGTVHGAYKSGIAEAKAVQSFLQEKLF